jgi:ABC-type branched-subunit amino acid transport system substrate-binding protein
MIALRRGAKALGTRASVVTELPYELTDRELGTHALKLKESGADTVILYSTITHGANLVKEMAKVGYKPKLVASFPLGDHLIMFRLLGPLWEGAHYNVLGAIAGEPDADRIADVVTKIEPKLKGSRSALIGATASTPCD